jgi:hypothetical protein
MDRIVTRLTPSLYGAPMPAGWEIDETLQVKDPSAIMPKGWNAEERGDWQAPLIDNPKCSVGCGEWKGNVDKIYNNTSILLKPFRPSDNFSEARLFEERPVISISKAGISKLSMCVKQSTTGAVIYSVLIRDGVDGKTFSAGFLHVQIMPSNRAPSFQLCPDCSLFLRVQENPERCCDGIISVNQNQNGVMSIPFVFGASAGRVWTTEALVHEQQRLSFFVQVLEIQMEDLLISDPSSMFTHDPYIDPLYSQGNSSLTFELRPDAYGKVTFNVKVQDDGESKLGGVDEWVSKNCTIYVVNTRVFAKFDSPILATGNNVDFNQMHAHIVNEMQTSRYLVILRVELALDTYEIEVSVLSWSNLLSKQDVQRFSHVIAQLKTKYSSNQTVVESVQESVNLVDTYFDVQSSEVVVLESSVEAAHIFPSYFTNISQKGSRYVQCKAKVTCSGTCACPSPGFMPRGHISDGPGDYMPESECSFLISTGSEIRDYACGDIELWFDAFETEAHYDTVQVFACSDEKCKTRTELASLSDTNTCTSDQSWADAVGQTCGTYDRHPDACLLAATFQAKGYSAEQMCCGCGGGSRPNTTTAPTVYSSRTGFMLMTFQSDDVVQQSGFEATWRTSISNLLEEDIDFEPTGLLPSIISSPSQKPLCTPLCRSADLSFTVLPFAHGSTLLNFTLGRMPAFTRQITITILPVNNAPTFTFAFDNSVLRLHEFTNRKNLAVSLVMNISKGPPPL